MKRVEVEAEATFEAEGAGAERLAYRARVSARASREEILDLMRHTEGVAEIQKTLGVPCPVQLTGIEAHEAR